jgi:diguanylate cyclase (GGDEF)-like protein
LVYSRFGGELLRNRTVGGRLRDFVAPCPVIEASAQIDRLLDLFTRADASDGIIITRDQRYVGYLSAATLVRLAHDRHVSLARDQNPLTKLPGNNLIAEHIESVLTESGRPVHLVYFDFDSFKPFNDSLGFRQGDRAILMFADILQAAPLAARFIGHVGGDDFFLSILDLDEEPAIETVKMLQSKFARDAESLYDADSRAAGSIRAKDRDGKYRDFPLLSVSAVMATLPADRGTLTPDQITRAIADGKGPAKATGLCHLRLTPAPRAPSRELEGAEGGSGSSDGAGPNGELTRANLCA